MTSVVFQTINFDKDNPVGQSTLNMNLSYLNERAYKTTGEDKSVRQKRLYLFITPALRAQEKMMMEDTPAANLTRSSPRNQSYKARRKPPTSTDPTATANDNNSSFLDLIRNSESSSSLRCKTNPYKGSAGNLSGRRFSNDVVPAKNGLPVLKTRNLSKANSVDCSDHVPSIIVDKALEDVELQVRETDSLLPQTAIFNENGANKRAEGSVNSPTSVSSEESMVI